MPDFSAGAELSITVPDQEIQAARQQIESGLSDIAVSVDAGTPAGGTARQPRNPQTGQFMSTRGPEQRLVELESLAETRNDLLRQLVEETEQGNRIRARGGGGAGAGTVGLLALGLGTAGLGSALSGLLNFEKPDWLPPTIPTPPFLPIEVGAPDWLPVPVEEPEPIPVQEPDPIPVEEPSPIPVGNAPFPIPIPIGTPTTAPTGSTDPVVDPSPHELIDPGRDPTPSPSPSFDPLGDISPSAIIAGAGAGVGAKIISDIGKNPFGAYGQTPPSGTGIGFPAPSLFLANPNARSVFERAFGGGNRARDGTRRQQVDARVDVRVEDRRNQDPIDQIVRQVKESLRGEFRQGGGTSGRL